MTDLGKALVGYVQFRPDFMNVQENLTRIASLVEGQRADLLVLPELATTGYAFPDKEALLRLAEPIPGPTTDFLSSLAAQIKGHLIAGLAEKDGEKIFNSAVLVSASGVLGRTRKSHLFLNEKDLFSPGDVGFYPADIGCLKVGMMICFDWAFPEAAGTLARRGAQLIAHPSNLVLPHAAKAMPVRCLENRIFAITANRWGEEQSSGSALAFRGESMIIAPSGEIIACAPKDCDEIKIVSIDPHLADDKHLTPRNDLIADRRPELYGEK